MDNGWWWKTGSHASNSAHPHCPLTTASPETVNISHRTEVTAGQASKWDFSYERFSPHLCWRLGYFLLFSSRDKQNRKWTSKVCKSFRQIKDPIEISFVWNSFSNSYSQTKCWRTIQFPLEGFCLSGLLSHIWSGTMLFPKHLLNRYCWISPWSKITYPKDTWLGWELWRLLRICRNYAQSGFKNQRVFYNFQKILNQIG